MLTRAGMFRVMVQSIQECKETINRAQCLQFVRWRKRRWAPVTATKMYHVPERNVQDPEEYRELKVRNDNYNTFTKALYYHFREEHRMKKAEKTSMKAMRQEAEEMREAIEINRIWNEETGSIREAKHTEEAQDFEERRLEMLVQLDQEEKEKTKEAKLQVQKAKELEKGFITLENMELEIEKALNTRANYNFSLDLKGNRYLEMPDGNIRTEQQSDIKQDNDKKIIQNAEAT